MANKRGPKGPMTDDHKQALEVGRNESRIIRDYLGALRAHKPKRGRKRTPDSINARLAAIEEEITSADPLTEVKLVQERMDLAGELETLQGDGVDLTAVETEFVKVAKSYSDRQGISYAAWRSVGIEPSTLRAAGITR